VGLPGLTDIAASVGEALLTREAAALVTATASGRQRPTQAAASPRWGQFAQVNVRVGWNYKFKENIELSLFFEGFNIFNTATFGNQFDGTKNNFVCHHRSREVSSEGGGDRIRTCKGFRPAVFKTASLPLGYPSFRVLLEFIDSGV
jgi:hypothetical protein